jgi:hypothetical protein
MYLVFVLQAVVGAIIKLIACPPRLLTDAQADARHQ